MNQVDQDLFQKYLDGSLVEDQVRLFNSRLKSDAEFKENFELYKGMNSYLGEKIKHKDALEKLRSYRHNEKISVENSSNKLWKFILVLGLLIALIIGWTYVNKPIQKKTHQQLYAAYFDPGEVSLSSRGNASDSLLQSFQIEFNDQNFLDASVTFERLLSIDESMPNSEMMHYGVSLIGTGSHEDGRDILFKLDDAGSLTNDIYWYIGLSFLAEDNTAKAKAYLSKIEKSSVKYKGATELISLLSDRS